MVKQEYTPFVNVWIQSCVKCGDTISRGAPAFEYTRGEKNERGERVLCLNCGIDNMLGVK